jgi:hypothetical protein
MKLSFSNRLFRLSNSASRQQANTRLIVLALVFFCLGLGLSTMWFYRRGAKAEAPSPAAPAGLSDSTRQILQHLNSPLEIRFYSLLDPATVPDSTRAFAGRVNQLLAQYEQAGKGRVKVTRVDTASNASANSALADGLQAFNQDKGDACYLGIAVVRKDKKETLAQLSPEWESALESDLSRAIVRLNEASGEPAATTAPPPIDPNVEEEVKKALPNLATVSLEDGTRILRQAAVDELKRTGLEMDARIKEAQQKYLDAEKSHSAPDQETARQQILQLQKEQTELLKQIIGKSQAQVEALQRLKAGAQ